MIALIALFIALIVYKMFGGVASFVYLFIAIIVTIALTQYGHVNCYDFTMIVNQLEQWNKSNA